MSTNQPSGTPTQHKSPSELLEMQTQLLANMYQLEQQRHGQVEALLAQNQSLTKAIEALNGRRSASDLLARGIKIADVNMPFWSLVGFMVKVALASIPAYIVLGVIGGILFLVLGGCAAGLGELSRF
jgi:hypothetical protein